MALNQTFNQDSQGDIGIAGAVSTTAPTYTTGTEQPISLTTAGAVRTDSSATTQPISASTLPLPTGASTSALQTTGNTSLASIDAGIPASLGSTTSANSMPVVIASDQSAIPVTVASLPLPAGAATSALQTSGNASLTSIATTNSQISAQLPTALGPQSSSGSLSIVQATGTTFSVSQTVSTTGTLTSVANSVTSVTVLASNAARKGFIVYNDSTIILYIAFSATASTTAFSAKLQPGSAYTSDTLYTGIITGVASAASGSARVTEFT